MMTGKLKKSLKGLAVTPNGPGSTPSQSPLGQRYQRHRLTSAAVAAATSVVIIVSVIAAVTYSDPVNGGEATARAESLQWETLGVPYVASGKVYYRGASVDRPSVLTSMTATADSALLVAGEGETSQVIELPATGAVNDIGSNVLGVAIADPTRHLAVWTEEVGSDTVRIVAYDTRAHQTLATTDGDGGLRPYAVGAGLIVLNDGDRNFTWDPNDGRKEPIERASESELVTDITSEHVFTYDFATQTSRLLTRDGSEIAIVESGGFGTFDPQGHRIVVTRPENGGLTSRVYSVQSNSLTDLKVLGQIDGTRWTPGGDLIIRTGLAAGDNRTPETPTEHYTCNVITGVCLPLQNLDTPSDEGENGIEATAWGQAFSMYAA